MNTRDMIQKAIERRTHLFSDPGTTCFRLFNADGDGLGGLTIDRYGEYVLIQFFAKGLYGERTALLRDITGALNGLPVPIRGILLKNRTKGGPGARTERWNSEVIDGEPPPKEYTVMQEGVRAIVDLVGGQNTGLFLDMREIRREMKPFYGEGKGLLNLFCHTGIFSVHALKNGAGSALNIDLSRPALEWAGRNYRANGLACRAEDFIFGDAFDWLKLLRKRGRVFSFVIFDPPTFSRHGGKTFSIKKNFREFMRVIADLSDGFVFTSVNAETVSSGDYRAFHPPGWKPIFMKNESDDFPYRDRPYLKAGLWRI